MLSTIYDAAGNVTRRTNPQGIPRTFEYDTLDRLTATTLDPDGRAVRTSLAYDLADNLLTRVEDAGAGRLNLATRPASVPAAVGQMLLASLQIAGPLIVVLFLADAGLGLLTRGAPALNAFALGFPLKILITLTLGSVVFAAMPRIVESITGDAVGALVGVK